MITQKFSGKLFNFSLEHCPFDVVGWFGNYYPYKYDFADFVAVNSVTVDHIDPSIFTVLTSRTNNPGVALLDVVIFPPRWSVHTIFVHLIITGIVWLNLWAIYVVNMKLKKKV